MDQRQSRNCPKTESSVPPKRAPSRSRSTFPAETDQGAHYRKPMGAYQVVHCNYTTRDDAMMASCHKGLLVSCLAFRSLPVLQVYVCRTRTLPRPPAGLNSHCPSPSRPTLHTSSCCNTTHAWLYVIQSIVYVQMQHIGEHYRECNGHFTHFVAAESFSSSMATFLVNDFREERSHWLQVMSTLHYKCLCSCMSNCAVPKYTCSNGAGAKEVYHAWETLQGAHTNQINWALGVKHAWARDRLPSVSAP